MSTDTYVLSDQDSIRGANEWLRNRMSGRYTPAADRVAPTGRLDMTLGRRGSRWFDNRWRMISALFVQ